MQWMDQAEFINLPTPAVAELVRASDTKVCVFPFNGTRRWFLLEHAAQARENFVQAYIEATAQAYIQTYQLLFEHGIETVIAPVFGSEILRRGETYMRQIGASMALLAEHPAFLDFYKTYDARVRFYGDYRQELENTPYAYIVNQFDEAMRQTATHHTRRLLYGVFGSDATQSIAKISIAHYQRTGQILTRQEIIAAYYGESLEKADLFIGFEKFSAFDYPMLNWGEESLYFTVAPSLYMTARQLRSILYDHIYLRPIPEPDYAALSKAELEAMRAFYLENQDVALGVGEIRNGIWYAKK
ncbi:MAG: hypothetical protein IT310_00045 [Anaerolineales bacterium]|nr:hypothetical protein [Anaerolineales bacterium]